jgi:hypothetical protein
MLSLGIFHPRWLWPKFDIDHASRVSLYACMASMRRLLPKYVLMKLSSFAIWDRNKVIMAICSAICAINLGFQLLGKLNISTPL